ncbi:MAG: hypothetical protein EOO05_05340 [Chitinophagaceae bacterium]|nr:MAG: hypothetical protein EOO05_05340 [Chitinophagaceae bacterium]
MRIPLAYCGIILLCCCTAARAQLTSAVPEPARYSFRNIDNRNGLFGNDVYSITQDHTGFIWIGSSRGLQRYDGFRFVSFIDTAGIRDEPTVATALVPDFAHNRILYNQFNQQMLERNIFNGRSSRLLPANELDRAKASKYTDSKGRQWLFQQYSISKVSADSNFVEGIAIIHESSGKETYFAEFSQDIKRTTTWTTEPRYGVLRFDNHSASVFTPVLDETDNPLFPVVKNHPQIVRSVRLDNFGNVWMIGWADELWRYQQNSRRLELYSLSSIIRLQRNRTVINGWVNEIIQDNHGRVWLATSHAGLLQYLPQLDQFAFTLSGEGESSLQYNLEINEIYQDRDENIWLGTDRGVSVFNPYRQYFSAMAETREQGDLSLRYEVTSVLAHSGGDLLLGLHGGGLSVFNPDGTFQKQINFTGKDEPLVWSMVQSANGETWIGCQHGVVHVLDKSLHRLRTVFLDPSGRCWVGNDNGLAEYDPEQNRYRAFYKPLDNAATACNGMASLDDHTLVLGMDKAGLVYFNTLTKHFTMVPLQPDGAPWSVHGVTKDSTGAIWFTTDFSVCRYDPLTKELTMNAPDNGLMNSAFCSPMLVKTVNGQLASTTRTEAISFTPSMLTMRSAVNDPVRITGLRVFEQRHLVDSLLHLEKPVTLGYRDNFITVEFSDLRFSGSLKTRYFYQLSGIDKEWVDAGSKSFAGYTNLPPGNYRFRVTSGSPSNEQGMGFIDFIIVPPFWATAWFRILVIVLAAAVIGSVAWWYIARIRRESDMKRQIATTEMMALRAQMNPHFIFNCINSIDAMIQQDDKYHATIYLNKFAKLIRNILDSSRQQTISFRKDLEALQLYVELEQFRSGNSFSAKITTDDRIAQNDIKVPPLIIQPYVENAILHGLKNRESMNGKLTIDIFTEDDQLVYVIEDNGVGRAASASSARKHRSHGMEITGDRLRLFNNKEDVAPVQVTDLMEDGQASGTRVQVSLKIKYA